MSAVVQMKPHRSDELAEKFGKYSGKEAIKPRQTAARSAATICTAAAVDYLPFLKEEERTALIKAAAVLRALGNDLEVAARKAETAKKQREAEWALKQEERMFALYQQYYGHLSDDALTVLASDLAAVHSQQATRWYCLRRKDERAYWDRPSANVGGSLQQFERQRTEAARHSLKLAIGRFLAEHHDGTRSGRYGTWADVQAWLACRAWCRQAAGFAAATGDRDYGDEQPEGGA